jgi:hypothetical protein
MIEKQSRAEPVAIVYRNHVWMAQRLIGQALGNKICQQARIDTDNPATATRRTR